MKQSLKRYLIEEVIQPGITPEEIQSAKKQYRKQYQKVYQQQYTRNKQRKSLLFTKPEYTKLKEAANEHQMKPATFAKRAIFAYLNNMYIVPDEHQVHKIEIALKAIGTNINQITFKTNSTGQLAPHDFEELFQLLHRLEQKIVDALKHPPIKTNSIP